MDGAAPAVEPECLQDQMSRISSAVASIDKQIAGHRDSIRELNERRDLMVAENRVLAWELKQRVYF